MRRAVHREGEDRGTESTGSWPTREQELLLGAVLWRGAEGLGAWEQWRARTTVDALDRDSQWLLPLLYHNLRAQGVAPRALARYRNVYLHTWYRNNLTLRAAAPALARLREQSRAVVLLGGAAMALRHYAALGARPFDRVSALALPAPGPAAPPRTASPVCALASLFDPETDAEVARRATEVQWTALRCLVLDPADQLVDICVRRRAWDGRSTLLWMADAFTTAQRNPELDWGRGMALAAQVGARHEVSCALRYLHERLGLTLPPAVRAALDRAADEGAA